MTVAALPPPADWTGSYTIKAGDSLYNVARQNRVKLDDLQRYNGIADVRRVKPGTVLKVPGVAGAVLAEAPSTPSSAPVLYAARTASGHRQRARALRWSRRHRLRAPKILNSGAAEEKKVAALDASTAAAVAGPASGSMADGKLRWPVKGRVIAGFGPRNDGTHNDGINISVPLGTDVHAAENGSRRLCRQRAEGLRQSHPGPARKWPRHRRMRMPTKSSSNAEIVSVADR